MLYEVTLFGRYYDQLTVNRFNYISTGIPATVSGAFGLAWAMGFIPELGIFPSPTVFSGIISLVSNQWLALNAVVRAASDYDVEDFYEVPFNPPKAGATAGEGMSPAIAYGYRTNRVRLDIDRGTKRFAGVSEGVVGNGGQVDPSPGTALANLALYMSQVLLYDDEGNSITYTPCIVSKLEYAPRPGRTAYKYYPTLAEQLEHVATGITWSPYDRVRTQTSRQYGRGQ